MSQRPEDERAQQFQRLLTTLGPEGVDLLSANLDEVLWMLARKRDGNIHSTVPRDAINATEQEMAKELAAVGYGHFLVRYDFARGRAPYWRLLQPEREVVSAKTWKAASGE